MAKISPASKSQRLAVVSRKEQLFEDFFHNMVKTVGRIERLFDVKGVAQQVIGSDHNLYGYGEAHQADEAAAKEHLRGNRAWLLVSELYDYAVEGIDPEGLKNSVSGDAGALVIDAGEVIALLTGEEDAPLQAWHEIVMMADGRYVMDLGEGIKEDRLALLANVDLRTVRNAISSGALVSNKEDGPYIGSDAARAWLMGRKGFKPTVFASDTALKIADVQTPASFGALLQQRRQEHERHLADAQAPTAAPLLDAYPGLTKEILAEAEAGVFRVALSMTRPLADYYGIERDALLDCVMRVFFPEELAALTRARTGNLNLVASSDSVEGGL